MEKNLFVVTFWDKLEGHKFEELYSYAVMGSDLLDAIHTAESIHREENNLKEDHELRTEMDATFEITTAIDNEGVRYDIQTSP